MKNTRFGVEIEMTGLTREAAANVLVAQLPGSRIIERGTGAYRAWAVCAPDGRRWKFVSDSSIETGGLGYDYSCEFVTPVLTYAEDMELLQRIVRALRKAGAKVNASCGMHIHLDGKNHDVRSLKNWAAIVASKNDLLYSALQVAPARLAYCKKIDASLVEAFKPCKTKADLKGAWYRLYDGGFRATDSHYHSSRYHFLNLHSFFSGAYGTIELRGFNSTLHAGEVRSYVVLALALNQQALTQKTARAAKAQAENEKFAMRTYLNRLGLIGEEYAAVREHLTKHLTGCAAWRFGAR